MADTGLKKRLFAPLADPAVWLWIVAAALASAAVFNRLSIISGGLIDLSTKEQDVVSCIVRQLANAELESGGKVAAIQGCIPKKVEERAEE